MLKPKQIFLILSLLVFGLFGGLAPHSEAKLVLDVENPNLARMPIAVPDFTALHAGPLGGRDLANVLRNDLHMTGLFNIIETGPPEGPTLRGDPDFQAWAGTGAQALVLVSFSVQGDQLTVEGKLYDTALRKMEIGKRFTGTVRDHRLMIHKFADRIMEQLTGVPGCFATRIAFVGTSQSRDLYVMDFDGHDLRRVTDNRTINLSPDWAPDGGSILFTSYMNGKPDLWSVDFATMRPRQVWSKPGFSASARYSPDGSRIALSSNFNGIPKIFIITSQGDTIKRLTDGLGNDISPTWSPDRSAIAFVSDQAGTPQIYVMPVEGGRPTRVTFRTNYNTDPKWSPRGTHLAFTARIEGRFQICTIRTDGTDFKVLTTKGSNHAPTWSPDGRMIAFVSHRDSTARIFVMDAEGTIQVPVSPISGKGPAWSPRIR